MTKKHVEQAKNSKTFCLLPFTHMATKTDGDLKLCCRSWPIGNIKDISIKELWNSEKYKEVREKLLKGEKPQECHACWRHEEIGVRSMRQRYNKTRTERFINNLESLDDEYNMPFKIPVIEAKLSNFCNLKCRMCHPLDSTSWSKDWKSIEHLMENANGSTYRKVKEYDLTSKPYISAFDDNKGFWEEFELLAPFIERIEFAGGEPLIDPIHYKILHILKPYGENIGIKYSTNLTKLNYKKDSIEELWNHFQSVNVMISIDGTYDVYDYIRQLGDYSEVKKNIIKIGNHPKITFLGAACTLQIYNSFHIPEIFDEFTEELNIEIHTHRVNYPMFLDSRVIPSNLRKNIVKDLEKYLESIPTKTHKNWTHNRKRNAMQHMQDAINMLNGGDMSDQIPYFIEYSDKLDQVQNVKKTWRELLPELAKEVDNV
jgi:radical SAM protein with 4Fe4S-binding SPASM domain